MKSSTSDLGLRWKGNFSSNPMSGFGKAVTIQKQQRKNEIVILT